MFTNIIFPFLLMISFCDLNAVTKYTLQEITVSDYEECVVPTHINDKGQVAGIIEGKHERAFFWDPVKGGSIFSPLSIELCLEGEVNDQDSDDSDDSDRSTENYTDLTIRGFNEKGQIVGIISTPNQDLGFLWDERRGFFYLNVNEDETFLPMGINKHGQILGMTCFKHTIKTDSQNRYVNQWQKLLHSTGVYIYDPAQRSQERVTVPKGDSNDFLMPWNISDNQQVTFVQYKDSKPIPTSFLIWDSGSVIFSSPKQTYPTAINSSGDIIAVNIDEKGRTYFREDGIPSKNVHWMWSANEKTYTLMEQINESSVWVNALNDLRDIVGEAFDPVEESGFAFIYDAQNGIQNLGAYTKRKNVQLESAEGINNQGQMIVHGLKDNDYEAAYILTPIK